MEAADPAVLSAWYNRLGEMSFLPKNIYNFDESGVQLGQGKAQNDITANPCTAAHIPIGGHAESVTTIEYVAANGWVMASYFLLKASGIWSSGIAIPAFRTTTVSR